MIKVCNKHKPVRQQACQQPKRVCGDYCVVIIVCGIGVDQCHPASQNMGSCLQVLIECNWWFLPCEAAMYGVLAIILTLDCWFLPSTRLCNSIQIGHWMEYSTVSHLYISFSIIAALGGWTIVLITLGFLFVVLLWTMVFASCWYAQSCSHVHWHMEVYTGHWIMVSPWSCNSPLQAVNIHPHTLNMAQT